MFNKSTCVALLMYLCSTDASAVTLRTVALSDGIAPNTDGAFFRDFNNPVLNVAGQVAFAAQLTGPGVNSANESGLWSEGTGLLSLVARTGEAAPGASNAMFRRFMGDTVLNGAGQMAFRASLTGPGVTNLNDQGIWSEGGGALALIVQTGDVAPGAGGGIFTKPEFNFPPGGPFFVDAFSDPVLNEVGETAFFSYLPNLGVPNSFGEGIWSDAGGSLEMIAGTGGVAQGTDNALFSLLGRSPVLNTVGQLAFFGRLSGPNVTPTNDGGIWSEQSGVVTLLARRGDSAPNLADTAFAGISQPALNNAGEIAFFSRFSGPSITDVNSRAIWSTSGGSLSLLARSGDIAPGADGAFFDLQSSGVKINAVGETLFNSSLTGPDITNANGFGIWAGKNQSSRLIARNGDEAPGTGGAFFSNMLLQSAILNANGQAVFHASLTGPGITDANKWGIWGEDTEGALKLIVRSGETLEVAAGDFRIVESFGFGFIVGTGNEDGHPGGFNDRGQLAFRANFVDGTQGVFMSNLIAVPEPSGIAIVALAALILGGANSIRPLSLV